MSSKDAGGTRRIVLLGGFSFYQIWVFSLFFGAGAIPASETPIAAYILLRLASLVVLGALLLLLGMSRNLLFRIFDGRVSLLALVSMEACVGLAPLAQVDSVLGIAVMFLLALLSGFGTAVLGLLWMRAFRESSFSQLLAAAGMAIALEIVLYFVAQIGPLPFWGIMLLLAPASFGCAWGCVSKGDIEERDGSSCIGASTVLEAMARASAVDAAASNAVSRALPGGKILWAFGACWGLTGAAFGFMVILSDAHKIPQEVFPWIAAFACLLGVAFAVSVSRQREKGEIPRAGSILMVLLLAATLAGALLPQLYQEGDMQVWAGLVSLVSISLIELFSMMLYVVFARTSSVSGSVVYCFGAGFRSVGAFVGSILGGAIALAVPSAAEAAIVVALVCAAQIITAMGIVFSFVPVRSEKQSQQRWESPISSRCHTVAQTYGLTPREEEVMVLLAKGYSVEGIQKELFIAKGTATTHSHHIYKKLGIHSRQELLDLVDNPSLARS